MKFPTMDEFAKSVAEKALDEIEYNGKTIREWIEIILATDTNVATKDSTNLAEVGTDCSEFPNNSDAISRQAAIDALENDKAALDKIIKGMSAEDMLLKYYVAQHNQVSYDIDAIVQLPPIQPEPHWIPVDLENNEPQLEEWVLVSSDGYVMQDCIVERGGKKIWYHGGNIQADDRYMPLPEPYKGVTT